MVTFHFGQSENFWQLVNVVTVVTVVTVVMVVTVVPIVNVVTVNFFVSCIKFIGPVLFRLGGPPKNLFQIFKK